MTWKPRWHERNLERLQQLAPHTRAAAMKWYQYCLDRQIDVYVTETLRTITRQRELVASGASKTLNSYHLVGQAFDMVPMIAGQPNYNLYRTEPFWSAVQYAKSLGFEWGGDWKSFVDSPHFQYNHKGYGTDTGSVPYTLPTLRKASIVYEAHVEHIGWQNARRDGETAGTTGQGLRMEAVRIYIENAVTRLEIDGHVQDVGWTGVKTNGEIVGTVGEARRLEAIRIKADSFNVVYRVHVQDIGWTDWKQNGEVAGTVGEAKRIEAIEIKLT